MVSVERWRVSPLAAAGKRSARAALKLFERMTFYISGTQLGVTVVSLLLGWLAEPTIANIISPAISPSLGDSAARVASVAIAFVVATSAQVVLGEQVPKVLAISRPLGTCLFFARPLRIYGYISRPFISVISYMTARIVRFLGLEPTPELRSVLTLAELEHVVRSSGRSGALDIENARLLTRSLRFVNKTASDALVPRLEVVTIQPSQSLDDLVATSARCGFSRFPVVRDDLDHVVGVVGVKAIHSLEREERSGATVEDLMGEALAVPDSAELGRLLGEMRKCRQSLAIVVDEHGGTLGIITTEDIVEEIVGEIDDEYDTTAQLTQPPETGAWLLEGDLSVDTVEEITGLLLPSGPFETLAGFVLYKMGRIPDVGASLDWQSWNFEVVEMSGRRIAYLRMLNRSRVVAEFHSDAEFPGAQGEAGTSQ